MLLDKINSPDDLKKLNKKELIILAEELRTVILEVVSSNGGHLSSNLGVVELAIAIHYIFNSPEDKIVWDVGHQSYPHKLLTGRYKVFNTLRKYKGLSGFPKISESDHDAFGTGHSSTSISAALGILEGKTLSNYSGKVLAVIGDGALTSGLAFEGLNHAGYLKKNLIVILNNNEMSISPNVGALSTYLSRVITGTFQGKLSREVIRIKEEIKVVLKNPFKNRNIFMPGGLFEDLGFEYIPPIDGHNISLLTETLQKVKENNKLTLIHVVTKKGKGYKFSENDPCSYHGMSPFVIKTGNVCLKGSGECVFFSDVFGNTLIELAKKNKKIIAITAAMKEGTGLSEFSKNFPERFYDVGIAESHAVTFAAGLATQGIKPVVAIYSTFLQRSYDQIIHDVCLQKLPVILAIDRSGIVGEDGPTHHGVFDISFLSNIPNLVFMSPKDTEELKEMLKLAIDYNGPVAIRYPREKMESMCYQRDDIKIGKWEIFGSGSDVAIVATGSMVYPSLIAAETLKEKGINSTIINARFLNPLDYEILNQIGKSINKIVTVEEGLLKGGFGSSLVTYFNDNNFNVKIKRIGISDEFITHGSQNILREKYNLNADGIFKIAFSFFE